MASKDLIDTLIAEAGGEGDAGLIAAAWAIQQRAAARGQTPDQVIKSGFDGYSNPGSAAKRSQQDPAMRARVERILTGVQNGTIPNPVPGADHFLSGDVMPSWAKNMKPVATIGGHRFYASGNVPQAAYGPLIPPGELPEVATLTDTVGPRVAPIPRTMSDDLGQMRNPLMSPTAMAAQVTPLPPPLPRNRPSAPDIVTPSMAVLARPSGNVNATRAVDMLAATANPVTPRLTDAGDNIYSYHIPDMTPTTVTGGLGSLTPSPTRVRLPELPPSNLGAPPTTRVVQSVPVTPTPTSSMPRPTAAQINDAARRASLMSTQSNVERAIPTTPMTPTTPQSFNPRARDSNYAANTALGERVAAQMAPVFNQPDFVPNRLVPNPIVQPSFVPLNQAPLQVVPSPLSSAVPLPRRRPLTPISPIQRTAQPMPRMAAPASPLRIVVNGGNMIQPQRTTVQSLQSSGLSPSDAYALANAQAAQRARDSATSPSHVSSNSWFNEVTGRG